MSPDNTHTLMGFYMEVSTLGIILSAIDTDSNISIVRPDVLRRGISRVTYVKLPTDGDTNPGKRETPTGGRQLRVL